MATFGFPTNHRVCFTIDRGKFRFLDISATEEINGALATILKSNCYHIIIDLATFL